MHLLVRHGRLPAVSVRGTRLSEEYNWNAYKITIIRGFAFFGLNTKEPADRDLIDGSYFGLMVFNGHWQRRQHQPRVRLRELPG